MRIRSKLPAKPSALIRLALSDLRKVEQDDRFVVDMNDWFAPLREDGSRAGYGEPATRCAVCLAGAVMAKTGRRTTASGNPWSPVSIKDQRRLEAIDSFRAGEVLAGLGECGLNVERLAKAGSRIEDRIGRPVSYEENPVGFKKTMRRMAGMLSRAGL